MDRKLIFFDIDGTLKDEKTQVIPESTVRAIREAQARGHKLFINTGRTAGNLEQELIDMGFDGYLCGCGTHIRINGELLLCEEMTHEESAAIVRRMRELGVGTFYEGNKYILYDVEYGVMFEHFWKHREHFIEMGIERDLQLDDPEMIFTKFFVHTTDDTDMDALHAFIDDRFDCIPRRKYDYEITPKGRSKATAIDFVLRTLGGTLDDCYALGDSTNDLPMLSHVPHAIAMGNGDPELFPVCEYVTASVMDDGVEKALRHYDLI